MKVDEHRRVRVFILHNKVVNFHKRFRTNTACHLLGNKFKLFNIFRSPKCQTIYVISDASGDTASGTSVRLYRYEKGNSETSFITRHSSQMSMFKRHVYECLVSKYSSRLCIIDKTRNIGSFAVILMFW